MVPQPVLGKAALIQLAVFDVDGVMTNGDLIFDAEGREYKVFNVQDGFGIVLLREAGIQIAVISARTSPVVTQRMSELGVSHIMQGERNKLAALTGLLQRLGLKREQASYTGDDIIDIPAMQAAGLGIAVADAHPKAREQADWTTSKPGGRGAVREICELILTAQDKLEAACRQCLPK